MAARHIWNPSLESIAAEEAERAGDMRRREQPGAAIFDSTLSSYQPRTRRLEGRPRLPRSLGLCRAQTTGKGADALDRRPKLVRALAQAKRLRGPVIVAGNHPIKTDSAAARHQGTAHADATPAHAPQHHQCQ